MKFLLRVIAIFFSIQNLQSQNLLFNGSFEDINTCTEYNAPCASEAWFRIPPTDVNVNTKKTSSFRRGRQSELVVVDNIHKPIVYRVFLYSMMAEALQKDETYTLTLYMNTLKNSDFKLGVVFSEHEIVSGEIDPIGYTNNITIDPSMVTNTTKDEQWKEIKVIYTAIGGERFINLGNFNNHPLKNLNNLNACNSLGDIIYLIDDITLTPSNDTIHALKTQTQLKDQLYNQNHRHTYRKRISKGLLSHAITLSSSTKALTPIGSNQAPKIKREFEIPDVAFDFDKSEIKKAYYSQLDSIIKIIKTLEPKQIQITGHTDNIGDNDYNQNLSEKRAKAIHHYLRNRFANKSIQYNVRGKGEVQPKADNTTTLGRAQNRRVVISIY